jgi:hypothetical protein
MTDGSDHRKGRGFDMFMPPPSSDAEGDPAHLAAYKSLPISIDRKAAPELR